MMPTRSHKVSATSSIFETSSPPKTLEQWKRVLAGIKLLYLQRQYKRCAVRSAEILRTAREPVHPVYKTFLCFYSAVSYEILGRSAHDCSNKKISLLQQALDYFVTCSSVLPSVLHVPNMDTGSTCTSTTSTSTTSSTKNRNESPPSTKNSSSSSSSSFSSAPSESSGTGSPVGSLVSCITSIIEKSIDGPDDDPFVSDNESQSDGADVTACQPVGPISEDEEDDDDDNNDDSNDHNKAGASPGLLPSPLRVRKSYRSTKEFAPTISTGSLFDNNNNNKARKAKKVSSPGQAQSVIRTTTMNRPPPLPFKIVTSVDNQIESEVKTSTSLLDNDDDDEESCGSSSTKTIIVRRRNEPAPNPPLTPNKFAAIARYNNHVRFMRSQINSSISAIYSLIDELTELQRSRRVSKFQRSASFWSFSPVKDYSYSCSSYPHSCDGQEKQQQKQQQERNSPRLATLTETKEQRIARLRAEGWNTVGLKSGQRGWKGVEYYRAYCGSVLDELYLGTTDMVR